MKKFTPIGKLYRIEASGCIALTDRPGFQGKWKEPLDYIVQQITAISEASVYVRGSVAEGTARDNESDIDICILKDKPFNDNELPENMMELIDGYITSVYPFVRMVDFSRYDLSNLNENDHFFLKTFAQHVAGPDILKSLSRPTIHMHKDVQGIRVDGKNTHNDMLNYLEQADPEQYASALKAYVRAMFVPIGKARGCYSRDLYHCCEMIKQAYPGLEYFTLKVEDYVFNWEKPAPKKELQHLVKTAREIW